MPLTRIAVVLSALLLGACAAQPPSERLRGALPATYVGTLPCADCPGLEYTLRLHADGSYFLRRNYLERGPFDEVGRWLFSSDQRVLALQGGERFAVDDADAITLRDSSGAPIVSSHNYTLRRSETTAALEPRLTLRGSYVYMADAANFSECRTGRRFAVLPGDGAHAVEKAYLAGRGAPGEPLLVEVEGRLTEAVVMEGAPRPAIEITRFLKPLPEPECGATFAPLPLTGTRWVAVQLGGQALDEQDDRRPSLQLTGEKRQVAGFTGCNRLVGGFAIDGDALTFDKLAATRMACPGASVLEVTFTDALKATARHAVIGNQLELYDADGTLLVRFAGETAAP